MVTGEDLSKKKFNYSTSLHSTEQNQPKEDPKMAALFLFSNAEVTAQSKPLDEGQTQEWREKCGD